MALQLAVWKCIEVLGESAGRILRMDASLADRFPSLQLREAYAMRNRLTHGYNDVDILILWNTARDFVPLMVAASRELETALPGEE